MSKHPPSANDVILLKMMSERPLKSQEVQDMSSSFESVAKESSQLGRYLLEKARLRGWADRVQDSAPGRRLAVSYHITDEGRSVLNAYSLPDAVVDALRNGTTVIEP